MLQNEFLWKTYVIHNLGKNGVGKLWTTVEKSSKTAFFL